MDKDNLLNFELEIYNSYINMRRNILKYDGNKYDNLDPYINSQEFKAGFIAGIKVMQSLFNKDY